MLQDTSVYRLPRGYFTISFYKGKWIPQVMHKACKAHRDFVSSTESLSQTNVLKIHSETCFKILLGNRPVTERIRHFVTIYALHCILLPYCWYHIVYLYHKNKKKKTEKKKQQSLQLTEIQLTVTECQNFLYFI